MPLEAIGGGNGGGGVAPPVAPQPTPPPTPPLPIPIPPPPPPTPVPNPATVAAVEAAVLAMVAAGATPADALAAHPLPPGMSAADILAFLSTLPQTQAYLALDAPPQIITGPPISTLAGDGGGDAPDDPTAFDGWSFDPFFGSGGGLSEEQAEAKILRGNAWVNAVANTCGDNSVDFLACCANAVAEGISGGIGDNGSAYGPWQVHATDGRISQYANLPPYDLAVQGWAWTLNGIQYVIRAMRANGAKGVKGHAAVHAIVYGFEKPGDKPGAYTTRIAIYDTLLAKGGGVSAYLANLADGPSLTVQPTYPPNPPTGGTVSTSIDGTANQISWQNLMNFLANDVPFAATHAENLSDDLTDIFK